MHKYPLFLGFRIDFEGRNALAGVDPDRLKLFVNKEPIYLHKQQFDGHYYLGKELDPFSHFAQIELLEENIYSLLKTLNPNYPFKQTSLVIFPLVAS